MDTHSTLSDRQGWSFRTDGRRIKVSPESAPSQLGEGKNNTDIIIIHSDFLKYLQMGPELYCLEYIGHYNELCVCSFSVPSYVEEYYSFVMWSPVSTQFSY